MKTKQFIFENYIIRFSNDVIHEIFDDEWFYGIIFFVDGDRYEILHNKHGMNRLLINYKDGGVKDVPFYMGTVHFLPTGVSVDEIE